MNAHNLPPQPTLFIGREPEVAELEGLLDKPDCRLLSLVGPGGIGKTRLVLEVARRRVEAFQHGVFLVSLASLNDPADIVPMVINVLGILIGDEGTPREELVKFLRQRHLLLIMDNFEHVLEGVDLLSDILQAAPDVTILATSREVLNLQEEWVWQVRGMRFPDDTETTDLEPYSALKLFFDRAGRVRRDFSPEEEKACAIRICQAVGGMPLALELAASWVKTLTCAEVEQEIQCNIDFLATNVRNVPQRHRSIRAVFDYSWNLCIAAEQAVFQKLCVFRGGFEREAAEQVAGASLLILSSLVEKSMLRKLPSGRYDIHELLRQFAEEKLNDVGELDMMADAHKRYYVAFMQERTPDIKGRRQLEGLNEIESDFDNVRTAWQRAVAQVDYAALDDMMEGLALFCDMRSRYQTGEDLFQVAVEALTLQAGEAVHPTWNRLRARWIQAWILPERSPVPDHIREQLEDCQTVAEMQGDVVTVGLCLWLSGELDRVELGWESAILKYEAALAYYDNLDDEYYMVRVLRGITYVYSGYVRRNREHLENMAEMDRQHLNLARKIGDRIGMGHAVFYLGNRAVSIEGDTERGHNYYQSAIEIWREMGDRKSVGAAYVFLGNLFAWSGKLARARSLLTEGKSLLEASNYFVVSPYLLGLVAALEGDYEQARQLCETWVEYYDRLARLGLCVVAADVGDYRQVEVQLRKWLDIKPFFPPEMTCILPLVALLLVHEGKKVQAVELLGLAFTHPASITGWMEKWSLLMQTRRDLEAELGTDEFQVAWERGSQLDLEATFADLVKTLRSGEVET
ncbi:NB-ARC domain-containing protein, partial [Chloroflexota bacterium]